MEGLLKNTEVVIDCTDEKKKENEIIDSADVKIGEENEKTAETVKLNESASSKKETILNVVFFQFCACLAIIIFLLCLRAFSPVKFENVRKQIKTSMRGEDFKQSCSKIFLNLKNVTGIVTPNQSKVDNEKSEEQTGSNLNADTAVSTTPAEKKEENTEKEEPKKQDENLKKEEKNQDLNSNKKAEKFVSPVASVSVTSKYGERVNPFNKKKKEVHNGVDIRAKEGTSVRAVADGVVEEVNSDKKSGKYIKVKHKNGLETVYAHCSKINKKVGEKVKSGDEIAKSGSTGGVTDPHLHFGLKKNGKFANPAEILPQLS